MFNSNFPDVDNIWKNNVIQPPHIPNIEYEETIFKEMANDIKESQSNIENKIDLIIEESKKSDKANSKIVKWTLTVAVLTLIITIAGVIIQLF